MLDRYNLRLRKWFLEIMRDACRLELMAHRKYMETVYSRPEVVTKLTRKPLMPAPAESAESSFEQLQSESIAAQEKFYEPVER